MRTYYIYKITNKINNKSYIGQHKIPLCTESFYRYFGRGIAIKEAINKYGKENFTKEILEYIEDDDEHKKTSEREKYWIKKENTMYPNGYNISPGGEGGITSEIAKRSAATRKEKGYKMSEEVKEKISKSNKNKKKSELHKKHLSENHRLKTLHRIMHENGTIEETYDAMNKIAKQYGTSQNTLLRHSAKKEFINGIYLLDIDTDKYECCSYSNDKKKRQQMCIDPITGEKCTLCALRLKKYKQKGQYENIDLKSCIIGDINYET